MQNLGRTSAGLLLVLFVRLLPGWLLLLVAQHGSPCRARRFDAAVNLKAIAGKQAKADCEAWHWRAIHWGQPVCWLCCCRHTSATGLVTWKARRTALDVSRPNCYASLMPCRNEG